MSEMTLNIPRTGDVVSDWNGDGVFIQGESLRESFINEELVRRGFTVKVEKLCLVQTYALIEVSLPR